jgi:hypothetical protein
MKRLALVAAVLVLAACGKKDENAGMADSTSTMGGSTMTSTDSAMKADSVRKADSARMDSIAKDTSKKKDTTKK